MKGGKGKIKKAPSVPERMEKLGKRIKELRIAKGYTSHETFAYEHNINRPQYWRYENGQDLRFSTLLKVIDALGVTVDEFFEGFE